MIVQPPTTPIALPLPLIIYDLNLNAAIIHPLYPNSFPVVNKLAVAQTTPLRPILIIHRRMQLNYHGIQILKLVMPRLLTINLLLTVVVVVNTRQILQNQISHRIIAMHPYKLSNPLPPHLSMHHRHPIPISDYLIISPNLLDVIKMLNN